MDTVTKQTETMNTVTKQTETMNIVKEFCNDNFENIEDNIFKIIEEDLDDKLVLAYINREYTSKKFHILMNKDLFNIFNTIEDNIYNISEIDDIKMKMDMMKREINYEEENHLHVNKFIISLSLILLHDNKEDFEKYLNDNCENFEDLLKYATIISSGWIKPKFDCVKVLLNDF